jgi:hypothetical protein
MANFNTHLAVAAVGSGLCATVALAGHAAPNSYLLTLTLAGAIGGILPDVDLEEAVPSRMVFEALGVVLAFISLFAVNRQYSIAELWIVWLGVYLLVRYGLHNFLLHRTRHRGIFHSLLAGAFFMSATAVIFNRVFGEPAALSWLTGFFVLIGFIIHLVLDEIYSVDFQGVHLKKSFGTALKLLDTRSMSASVIMGIAFALMLSLAPPVRDFYEIVKTPTLVAFLKNRMLPKGTWFEPAASGNSAMLEMTEPEKSK